jgi:hemoglobin
MEMPRQSPHAALDEAMIHALVHRFYARVRADAELGPIFERAIGDHWDAHLATMCDFWSSVMLTSGRYKGNPMMAHMKHKAIQPQHFVRWLEMFGRTAQDICPADIAARFVAKAENIARSLQAGLFFRAADFAPGAAR